MVAAIASPAPSSVRHRHHPSYKEMILGAIESLKDRNGSSRTAISKFIAATYGDLPPAHDALLSTHIRRLKKKGLLSMAKHSYKLAGDSAGAPSPTPKPRGRPRKPPGQNPGPDPIPQKLGRPRKGPVPGANPAPPAERGKPGRPRRAPPAAAVSASTEMRKPGRPRKVPASAPSGPATTVRAPPPAVTGPAEKRKRGRPRKDPQVATVLDPAKTLKSSKGLKPGLGPMHAAVRTSVGKRKPGRPRKVSSAPSPAIVVDGNSTSPNPRQSSYRKVAGDVEPGRNRIPSAVNASVEKRKPGRPRKVVEPGRSPIPSAVNASVEKRKPGRPKKAVEPGRSLMPSAVNVSVEMRKPGRQKKVVEPGLNLTPVAVKPSVEKRKPGRPRKISSLFSSAKVVDGSAALLNPLRQSLGKVAGEVKPGRNRMPAAVDASVEKRKLGRPRKAVGEVEPVLGLMPQAVSTSIEKRKPGRPRKVLSSSSLVLAVDGNATLSNPVQPSPGKEVREVELSPDPMPAAVDASVEKRNPDQPGKVPSSSSALVGDENVTSLNPVQPSSKKGAGELELGIGPMSATLMTSVEKRKPGRPGKVLSPSSSAFVGKGSVILLNSMQSLRGKAIKRCGRPPKGSKLFGPASVEEKMAVEEKRKRPVGRPRKHAGGGYF